MFLRVMGYLELLALVGILLLRHLYVGYYGIRHQDVALCLELFLPTAVLGHRPGANGGVCVQRMGLRSMGLRPPGVADGLLRPGGCVGHGPHLLRQLPGVGWRSVRRERV